MLTSQVISVLTRLGFHKKSALLYVSLIWHWEYSITQLAQTAHITRAETYRYLPYLVEKGLITSLMRGKRRVYTANPPTILLPLLHANVYATEQVIWEMQQTFDEKKPVSQVVIGTGKTSLSGVYTDIMQTWKQDDVFYRITSEVDTQKSNSYMPKKYRENRAQKNVSLYLIAPELVAIGKKPRLDREIAILPSKTHSFDDNISLTLYGNKMAYIDFDSELAVTIESEPVVRFQKKLFQLLFKLLQNQKDT